MIKRLMLLSLPALLWSEVHYAKLEPYEAVVLKAAVSGAVVDVNLSAEGRAVNGGRIVQIDDAVDRVNLSSAKESLSLLQEMVAINEESLKGLEENMHRQHASYTRMQKLSTASKSQKDSSYNRYITAKTQYLATKEKVLTLKKQRLDLQYKIAQLEDVIAKKSIVLRGKYLSKLMVHTGEFVAPGAPLAKVSDATRAKLVLYLSPEEAEGIEKRTVYLDGKQTPYHIDKVWRVADEKFVSSYRAEIYLPAPKRYFSKLVKVEIK